MRRPVLLLLLLLSTALPAMAQLRSVELKFEGVNCAPCLESLPARIQRMRGVESASVDPAKGLLTVKLAASNRVRLEQIRDTVEQDGTKAIQATVSVAGQLSEESPNSGKWRLQLPGNAGAFLISFDGAPPSAQYSGKAGPAAVTGAIGTLRPEPAGSPLTIVPALIEALEQ